MGDLRGEAHVRVTYSFIRGVVRDSHLGLVELRQSIRDEMAQYARNIGNENGLQPVTIDVEFRVDCGQPSEDNGGR